MKLDGSPYSEEIVATPNNFSQLYTFSSSSGTFTQLDGSTPQLSGNRAPFERYYNNIEIGFPFPYGGTTFNTLTATDNGMVRFGGDNYEHSDGRLKKTNTLFENDFFLLSPLGDDLAGGTFSYKIEGMAPNRVFIMEWLKMKWNYLAANPGISFQVKLHESTGTIQYHYFDEAIGVGSTNGSASIGLRSPGGNFISLQGTGPNPAISSISEASALNVKPISGQIYTFTSTLPVAYAPIASDIKIDMQLTDTYTFAASDFNYSDFEGDAFTAIKIVSAETQGDLEYNGADVEAGQIYPFPAGSLVFKPDLHLSSSFTFRVLDASGEWSSTIYTCEIIVHCTAPSNLMLTDVTMFSASFAWNPVAGVPVYELHYKEVNATTWDTWMTDKDFIDVYTLAPNQNWEAKVTSLCYSSDREFSKSIFFETPGPCKSKGTNTTNDWIEHVKFDYPNTSTPGLIDSKSGNNNGYMFFPSTFGRYYTGQTYSLQVVPGGLSNRTRHFRAWIDYNQNGLFEDSEKIMALSASTLNAQLATVSIPTTAKAGTTLLRVSVFYGEIPTPCSNNLAGEVEDYKISIVNSESGGGLITDQPKDSEELMTVYPNPGSDWINFQGIQLPAVLVIYDENGIPISRTEIERENSQIDVSTLRAGRYLLTVGEYSIHFIKE